MSSSPEKQSSQLCTASNTTPSTSSSNNATIEQNLQIVSSLNIENSDVYFGDKNIYQGPVVIEKIIYKDGRPLKVREHLNDKNIDGYDEEGTELYEIDGNTRKQSLNKECNKTEEDQKNLHPPLYQLIKTHPIRSSIMLSIIILLPIVAILLISYLGNSKEIHIISRLEWGAQPPNNATTPLITPVPYVIMHHTASESCSVFEQCIQHVRFIQNFHQESRGFYDIGYNFLIAGDGNIYMGRGWTVEGAHAFGYNSRSIGIAVIGTYTNIKPPDYVINTCKKLIESGVQQGYIVNDYKLLAARQLSGTESPGLEFFNDIKTWPHWVKEP